MLLKSLPIFCINLDRSKNRWENIKNQFLNFNQDVIRFPASDGKNLNDGDLPFLWEKIDRSYRHYGKNEALSNLEFKPGVVGCALSHYRLWKFAVKHNIDFFCVIEDDVKIIKKIENIEYPDNFDILYINDRIKSNADNHAIDGVGLDGYILSLKGAKKLIKVCRDLLGPVDYRVQAHIRGFIENSVQNKECLLFHSFKNKNIIIEGYKTVNDYVVHPSLFASCINKKYEGERSNSLIEKFRTKKNVVFISFNEKINIVFDKRPNFVTVVTYFLNGNSVPKFPYLIDYFCTLESDDMMYNQTTILNNIIKDYNFVAVCDANINIKVSEIEKIFEISQEKKLNLITSSLFENNYCTYDFTNETEVRKVDVKTFVNHENDIKKIFYIRSSTTEK